ncbi:response regulator [Aquimarina pacifica]|uniref:response regulator n=1 Tax=Aquimarina pacifica TaxID=1296415 RepID=UPI000470A554|nr:response regulator transcription factor [Aquimarina pacifica]
MNLTIVLADDHPLLLSGTEQFLKNLQFKVVGTAIDGNDAYSQIIKHQPDIAILDFDMPKYNGIEVGKLCSQKGIETKIIILTLYKQESIISEVGNSIHGYVLKNDTIDELANAITQVAKGHHYISKNLNENIHLSDPTNTIEHLTITEMKILRHLATDRSSSQIAESLFISKRTVEKHRSNIIKKLGISSSQNALLLWVQKNPNFFIK